MISSVPNYLCLLRGGKNNDKNNTLVWKPTNLLKILWIVGAERVLFPLFHISPFLRMYGRALE